MRWCGRGEGARCSLRLFCFICKPRKDMMHIFPSEVSFWFLFRTVRHVDPDFRRGHERREVLLDLKEDRGWEPRRECPAVSHLSLNSSVPQGFSSVRRQCHPGTQRSRGEPQEGTTGVSGIE